MFDIKRTAELIKGALLAPRTTWQAYLAENKSWRQTLTELALPLIVGAIVLSLLLSIVFTGGSAGTFAGFGLGFAIFGAIAGILGLIVSALIFAILAGVFKGQNDFDRAFAALSLTSVPAYAGFAIDSLPLIGFLLSLLLSIYGLVLTYQIVPDALGVPQERRVIHFICCLLVGFVALLVIGLVLFQFFGLWVLGR